MITTWGTTKKMTNFGRQPSRGWDRAILELMAIDQLVNFRKCHIIPILGHTRATINDNYQKGDFKCKEQW